MKKNISRYYLYIALYGIANMFCTGSILQTFLLKAGFSERQIYIYNALIQGIQVLTMFALVFFSDKIKKVKATVGMVLIAHTLLSIVLLIMANCTNNPFVIYLVYAVSGIVYVATGTYGVISYCLPYRIINMDNYGKLVGVSTAISGLATFSISLIYSYLVSIANYSTVMMWCYLLATLCIALAGYFCLSLKEVNKNKTLSKAGGYGELFRNKNTYILMLPSFLRGLTMGVISLLTVIGFNQLLLNTQTSTYLNILLQVATFSANILFAYCYRTASSGKLCIISTIGVASLLSVLLLVENSVWFICGYFLTYFFIMMFNTAIPVLVPEIIPENQIGAFTSVRMMLFTFGSMVASVIIDPIILVFGAKILLLFVASAQVISGGVHYIVWRKSKESQKAHNKAEDISDKKEDKGSETAEQMIGYNAV